MESLDLMTLVQSLIDWVLKVASSIEALPGTAAFALGLFTWFLVEQVLRRILSWIRWLILVGVLAGLGLSVTYIVDHFFDLGLPPIQGLDLSPNDLLPEDSPDNRPGDALPGRDSSAPLLEPSLNLNT